MDGEDDGDFCPTYAPVPPAKICSADQFVCTDGSCIPNVFVCDGVWQCEDGLYEQMRLSSFWDFVLVFGNVENWLLKFI